MDGAEKLLGQLGTTSYIDYTTEGTSVGANYEKVLFLADSRGITESEIHKIAAANPGAVWYVIGEMECLGPCCARCD
jgi:hypothetical protein